MNIDVVIVTFNRIEKLKKAIMSFEQQRLLPNRIVIVNNNSNDGTREFLEKWKSEKSNFSKVIINLKENIGGSGGFSRGIRYLMDHDAEWIWVSDDDAYPDKEALYIANEFLNNNNKEEISAICGQVISNGKTDYVHRGNIKKNLYSVKTISSNELDYKKQQFEIDSFSYVGTILNVNKMREAGIINKDFFIYYDDADHAIRMRKIGKIFCIPGIKIIHDIKTSNDSNRICLWRIYYLFRNQLYYLKWNFSKRYYIIAYFFIKMRILKRKLTKKEVEEAKVMEDAIRDFKMGKLGISSKYNPT